jgi:hypothetical protein
MPLVSACLPQVTCPSCGAILHALQGVLKSASCYEDCLRKCEKCEVAFSNGKTKATVIYRNPEQNVPAEARDGIRETLALAINVQHRRDKLIKFGFGTSEDALTWTVFTYLARSAQLGPTFTKMGLVKCPPKQTTMLLWGVPHPLDSMSGIPVRDQLIRVCDRIGEVPDRRSEPDVILDFADEGLIIIEVKYGAANAFETFGTKHQKYLDRTDAFTDADAVRGSRLYELARNWRIGVDLAAGRPFTLLNLVVEARDVRDINLFKAGLNPVAGSFSVVVWRDLLDAFEKPEWLKAYLSRRL